MRITDLEIKNFRAFRLDLRVVDEIERARKFILNELSHATFATIYRKELEDAIEAVEQLESALA